MVGSCLWLPSGFVLYPNSSLFHVSLQKDIESILYHVILVAVVDIGTAGCASEIALMVNATHMDRHSREAVFSLVTWGPGTSSRTFCHLVRAVGNEEDGPADVPFAESTPQHGARVERVTAVGTCDSIYLKGYPREPAFEAKISTWSLHDP